MRAFFSLVFIFSVNHLLAQQVADTLFNPAVVEPAYVKGKGTVVFVDQAHSNFHTINGRFKPFANVLTKDGYVVKGFSDAFTEKSISDVEILVIANALHPTNQGNWSLPTPSAFTDDEIAVVNQWVKQGGSLFLISDHMPFPGANEKLAKSFGFKFYNGFAMATKNKGKDIFTAANGLQETRITHGRKASESVKTVQTFTGQAFEIPATAKALIVLNDDFEMKITNTAWVFDRECTTLPAKNLVQGAYMNYGKGRLVVFGEAAMFTAQLQGRFKVGMNSPDATQNVQLLLNIIHWLDGLIQ